MPRSATLPALELRVGQRPVFNPAFRNALQHFQRFVADGSNIDVINLEPRMIAFLDRLYGTSFGRRACVVVADDMLGMDFNPTASAIAGQAVFGPALVCDVP